MRVHLDTDFGGDTDDACALAMLLGWPGVEVTGITTVADRGGAARRTWRTCCTWLVGKISLSPPVPKFQQRHSAGRIRFSTMSGNGPQALRPAVVAGCRT